MSYNRQIFRDIDLGKYSKPNPYKDDMIVDPRGQWAHPGQNTRIPGNDITMEGVDYPVWAQPNVGPGIMMNPGGQYNFPDAEYVDEYPMDQYQTKGEVDPRQAYADSLQAFNYHANRFADIEGSYVKDPKKVYEQLGKLPVGSNVDIRNLWGDVVDFDYNRYPDSKAGQINWKEGSGYFPITYNESQEDDYDLVDDRENAKRILSQHRVQPTSMLYTEEGEGNEAYPLYRKPTKPQKPTIGNLPTRKLTSDEPREIVQQTFPEPAPHEPYKLAYRSQTIINPDGSTSLESVPYAAQDKGQWDLMDAQRVVDNRNQLPERLSFRGGGSASLNRYQTQGQVVPQAPQQIDPNVLQVAISHVASANSVGIDGTPDKDIISFTQIYPELQNAVQERYNALMQEQTATANIKKCGGQLHKFINGGIYNKYPDLKKEGGEYVEMELTDDEIQELRNGGFRVDV